MTRIGDAPDPAGHRRAPVEQPSPLPGSSWWPERRGAATRSRLSSFLAALLVLGAGVLWLLDSIGAVDVSWRGRWPLGLLVVGAALLLATWWDGPRPSCRSACCWRSSWWWTRCSTCPRRRDRRPRHRRRHPPLDLDHELLMGDMTLDLTEAPLAPPASPRSTPPSAWARCWSWCPRTPASPSSRRCGRVASTGRAAPARQAGRHRPGLRPAGRARRPRLHLDLSMGFGTLVVRG